MRRTRHISDMDTTEETMMGTPRYFVEESDAGSKLEKIMKMLESRSDLILVKGSKRELSNWDEFIDIYVAPYPESFDPETLQSLMNAIAHYIEPTSIEELRVKSGKMSFGKLYFDEGANGASRRILFKLYPSDKVVKDVLEGKLNEHSESLDILKKYMRWKPKSVMTPFEHGLIYGSI